MLVTILIWFYIIILSFLYGNIFFRIINKIFSFNDNKNLSFPITIITGLVLLTVITQYLSLFIKIGLVANIIFFLISIVYLFLDRKFLFNYFHLIFVEIGKTNKIILIIGFSSIVYSLLNSCMPPEAPDTPLYHIQSIRWIEDYGIVPGIGNLHEWLAFNSSWFTTNALFSFSFLGIQSFHVVNGLFFIIVFMYFLTGINNLILNKFKYSDLIKIFLLFFLFFLWKDWLSSPTPDIPNCYLIWLIFIVFFEKIERRNNDFEFSTILVVLFSSFLLTVKLASAPIILLIIFLVINEFLKKRTKNLLIIITISFVVILPFILRNIIISGYLIYPYPSIDVFNFDWKIPHETAVKMKNMIYSWGRNHGNLLVDTTGTPFLEWIKIWYNNINNNFDKNLFNSIIILFIMNLGFIIIKFKKVFNYLGLFKNYLIIYITLFISFIFFILTSPDFRFAYGFLILNILFLLSPHIYKIVKFMNVKAFLFLLLFLFLIFFSDSLKDNIFRIEKIISKYTLIPADYNKYPYKVVKINNYDFYMAEEANGYNSYSSFPVIYYTNLEVIFRGINIKDGFRAKKK